MFKAWLTVTLVLLFSQLFQLGVYAQLLPWLKPDLMLLLLLPLVLEAPWALMLAWILVIGLGFDLSTGQPAGTLALSLLVSLIFAKLTLDFLWARQITARRYLAVILAGAGISIIVKWSVGRLAFGLGLWAVGPSFPDLVRAALYGLPITILLAYPAFLAMHTIWFRVAKPSRGRYTKFIVS